MDAHRTRRKAFRDTGATATDHGVPTALCVDLGDDQKQALLTRVLSGPASAQEAAVFRGQILTEMAGLSVEDGMVMQIHAGSRRTTDPAMLRSRGPNQGSDIPVPVDPVRELAPLLNKYGTEPGFRLIFFCLDETVYARELAPMAGYWPALMIGPLWWFHDSPRGIARYSDQLVETAGFRNLAAFNDDTRVLLSIPARHDVWRRGVCNFLGGLVAQHTLSSSDALRIATWLSADAAKVAYVL
ncbi:MAG: glucuronate isomerase [Paracoccaceae bacterium]